MSLIGSVGLTNNLNGLYLGSVNINNIDEFAITSNALYVNENINTIQSAVNQVSQADVINISSGSYTEAVTITDKYNIALTAPSTASTICEILNGIIIDGTSELIRLANLQVKGANSQIYGVGRHRLNNIVFTGSASQTNAIQIGANSTKFMTISNCEFDNYCTVNVSNLFGNVIYFINCNFGGATITLSQASPLQVIFNNCAGFPTSFPVNATYVGLNVLTSGVSRTDTTNVNLTTINNAAYPPSGVSVSSQANHRIVTATATTDALHANQTLTWDDKQLELFNATKLSIGRGNNASSAVTNTAVGHESLNAITSGNNNTCYGYHSGNTLTTASNNTIIGSSTTTNNSTSATVVIGSSATATGDNAVCIGHNSKISNSSTVIGANSGRTTGSYNTVVGRSAYYNVGAGVGEYNVVIGANSATANVSGDFNNILGTTSATSLTSGMNNCFIGTDASTIYTTQSNNCIIGNGSSTSGTAYNNCSSLGANINVLSGDNQVQLGDSATTTYVYGTVQTRSDSRDKTDIKDIYFGLDFIDKLKPKLYKWDYREDYHVIERDEEGKIIKDVYLDKDGSKRRNRWHAGLLAQDLKQTLDQMSMDFGVYQDHSVNGGGDKLTIGYEELIAPLIKAVQELSVKNKNLENRINLLENMS